MKKLNQPLVSVIVPVYNVENELLSSCISSIINQTYKNIEIIVIDDGNSEEYAKNLDEICNSDKRIRVVKHEQNAGLYQARLTGVKASNSEFITFVDADDAVSIDWIRLLVKKALEDNADIVMGRTISKDQNGWRYVYNSNYSLCTRKPLEDKSIFEYVIKDCGLDFSIHTVWNKLYSRQLWDQAWNDLNRIKKHLIMNEDIMFSFVLFYHAKKLSFSNHDGYFYYRNNMSSTVSSTSINKIKKNLEDIELVFSTLEQFLKDKSLYDEYKKYFIEWKDRYFRWWSYNVETACKSAEADEAEEIKNNFLSYFEKEDYELAREEDSYFEEKKTEWNDGLEKIKHAIFSAECKVVSFDLFDTLIKRPVLNPEDVYHVVLSEVNTGEYDVDVLSLYRKLAEESARDRIKAKYPHFEDVTIDEIYNEMHHTFDVPSELCQKLKTTEEKVEIEFAITRETGHELYDLALLLGKDIYITSDMYLRKDTIERILNKNNYSGYKEILLSSEERLLKATGNLFRKLIEISGYAGAEIIHIGDNWNADTVIPRKIGIKTFFIPKTKDILLNYLGNKNTGNAIGKAIENSESILDYSKYFESFTVRCMLANVASIMFDNPFVSFNEISDYNGDPYYLGCFALGMYEFGIAKWLYDISLENKYRCIHFTARDGYNLKNVYDCLRESLGSKYGKSNYLYMSRKALIAADIRCKNDVDKIINSTNYRTNTPKTVTDRYAAVLAEMDDDIKEQYKNSGFILDKPFASQSEWVKFVLALKKIQFSQKRQDESLKNTKRYFANNVEKNDLIFDLGYSGKLHENLIKVLGFAVDGAYVNFSGYSSLRKNKKNDLRIQSYYSFQPSMYGIVNEYILSDRNPSCIGFDKFGPLFEEKMEDYVGDYVVNELNRGALDFTESLIRDWANRIELLVTQPVECSLLYDKFLVAPTEFDQAIFDYCFIEDEYYGGIRERKIRDVWEWQRGDRRLYPNANVPNVVYETKYIDKSIIDKQNEVYDTKVKSRGKLTKAIYWFCVDKDFFGRRVHEVIGKRSN